jgi:DNA-binding MarR family transcriptional regulator
VRRRPHPSDRRATLAVLTARGRSLAAAATVDVNLLFESLPFDDPDGLFDALRGVREAAGDFTSVPAR